MTKDMVLSRCSIAAAIRDRFKRSTLGVDKWTMTVSARFGSALAVVGWLLFAAVMISFTRSPDAGDACRPDAFWTSGWFLRSSIGGCRRADLHHEAPFATRRLREPCRSAARIGVGSSTKRPFPDGVLT